MKKPTPAQHVRMLEHQLWCQEQDATAQAAFRLIQHAVATAVLEHLEEEPAEEP